MGPQMQGHFHLITGDSIGPAGANSPEVIMLEKCFGVKPGMWYKLIMLCGLGYV